MDVSTEVDEPMTEVGVMDEPENEEVTEESGPESEPDFKPRSNSAVSASIRIPGVFLENAKDLRSRYMIASQIDAATRASTQARSHPPHQQKVPNSLPS